MKKRVLSLVLALAMLATLAGCGGGDAAPQNEGQASGGPEEEAQAAAETTPEPSPEPTPEPAYRLTGASKYDEGEMTVQYALIYAEAGDSLPSVVRETRPDAEYETSYTYLADGRVLSVDREGDASTSQMDSYFDESGKLVWQAEVMQGRYYDENNEPAGWYTDREYSDYTYDEAGLLTAVTTVDDDGEPFSIQEYTYTDGQQTGETATYYYEDYDPASGSLTMVEDVTEYTYAYDAEGRQTRSETYRDGEMTSAADYTYAGPLRLASYASGTVSAAMLAGGGKQMLIVGVSAEAGEPAVQYDDAGCLVRIEADEDNYAEFTYEPYFPEPMAGAEAPVAAELDAVMMDNEYGTLTLKGYFPPYAVLEFANKSSDATYQLSVPGIELNGVGMPIEFRTVYTDPGQTSKAVVYLDPDILARFGILYPETISATASLGQEEQSNSGPIQFTAARGLELSAELPVPAGAGDAAVTEPVFGREPVTVTDTDEYKVTLVDAGLEDDRLRLTVQYENHTGYQIGVQVDGISVNGVDLPMDFYGSDIGGSYAEKGYMESIVRYQNENGVGYTSDLGPIIEQTGPIQTVDLTLSVGVYAEDYRKDICPPITITF